MRARRVVILSTPFVAAAFSLYLWSLYGQLKQAFDHVEQFVPTRIYSDVTPIRVPQTQTYVESRLKSLGYSTHWDSAHEKQSFKLHPLEYPTYLLPANSPTLDAGEMEITLTFNRTEKTSHLKSIHIGELEVPEIFLEPELVATLSRENVDGKGEIRALVLFDDIPALVWQAIIAVEDQHFMDHKGLDPRGFARAVWVNLKTLSFAQGGSTITQQLVKNLMARRTKNAFKKLNEMFLAVLLEASFDKTKILERYLNEVYLGQVGNLEIHGVVEGAKYFFAKRLGELNLAEIAFMAGLIRGPWYYSPYRHYDRALERQRLILRKMVEIGLIAEEEAKAATQLPIRLAPPITSSNKAPYFTDFVKAELIRQLKSKMSEQEIIEAGIRVYTSLDMNLNQIAQHAVSQGAQDLEKRLKIQAPDRLEGALASVDQSNGYIRALVGGRSYAQSTFNRILNMKRQVGSIFKPVVFLTALQKGTDPQGAAYGPAHPIEDAPWKLIYDRGKQSWSPKNYDKDFRGWIPYRTALAYSINTAAAKLGYELGIENVIQTARALSVESDLPNVPSLALGVAELSPVELLKVYAIFGNHGVQDELTVIRGITQENGGFFARFIYHPKQVFDPASVDLLTDMLRTVFTEGTARDAIKMGFDRPAAGKTGTTSHHRDAWFAGYTPELTTVVWVGMDQSALDEKEKTPVKGKRIVLTGASSALPIWSSYMKQALGHLPPKDFEPSPHLLGAAIDQHSGFLANSSCPLSQVVTEKYIKDRIPSETRCEQNYPPSVNETVAEK